MQWKRKAHKGKSRKAISPVIATIILVAVTLVISVAVGGYIFGLFGGYTQTAQAQITSSALIKNAAGGNPPTVTLQASNTGVTAVTATGGTLTIGGATYVLTVNGTVPATSLPVALPATVTGLLSSAINVGQTYTGIITFSNGAQVPFSGVVR